MTAFDDLMDGMMEQVVETLGRSVKLFKPATQTPNFTTGVVAQGTPTEFTVMANEHPVRQETAFSNASGEVAVKVKTYDVRLADLSGNVPDRTWRIGDTDDTWGTACTITNVEFDSNNKGCTITARENI